MENVEKSSPDLAQIFEPIRADLDQVDREFERHLQSHVDLIPKIGQYIQTSGGKRIRPAVLLMASRLSGYAGDRAILYAAVVEDQFVSVKLNDGVALDCGRGPLRVDLCAVFFLRLDYVVEEKRGRNGSSISIEPNPSIVPQDGPGGSLGC